MKRLAKAIILAMGMAAGFSALLLGVAFACVSAINTALDNGYTGEHGAAAFLFTIIFLWCFMACYTGMRK